MLRTIIRVLVGVSGALALVVAARIWMDPVTPAAQLGVGPLGPLGLSTLRADIGGFFGGAGLFALAAAIRNDARFALAPLVLISMALAGRAVTAIAAGFTPDMTTPIVVESALVVLYAAAWRILPRGPLSAAGRGP